MKISVFIISVLFAIAGVFALTEHTLKLSIQSDKDVLQQKYDSLYKEYKSNEKFTYHLSKRIDTLECDKFDLIFKKDSLLYVLGSRDSSNVYYSSLLFFNKISEIQLLQQIVENKQNELIEIGSKNKY